MSAKARNLGVIPNDFSIEAFIQTPQRTLTPYVRVRILLPLPSRVTKIDGLHLLTGGDADGRAVGVQCFQPAAVVDLDVIAVSGTPTPAPTAR